MSAPARMVGHDELGRFIRDLLVKHGARMQDAAVVAEGLVWANLRGGDGHGVSRLPRYLKLLDSGDIDTTAQPRIVHDRGATLMIDGGHGFGPVAVMEGAARAVERAKATGVCFALIRNTGHTGAIGRYAQWIAEQGCAAPIQAPAHGPQKRTRHTGNTAMLVIDIATFRPLVDFQTDADALGALIKALPRQAGFDEILLPGERGRRTEAARRKSGIPIPAKLWDELAAIAKADDVKMPQPLAMPAAARAGE